MDPFQPAYPADVGALVEAYPLCWVVSVDSNVRHATPLPLLPELDEAGNVQALFGHMALANPQRAALERDGAAMILAMGPQGYISPRLVSNSTWGPTWNYAVCRFETELRFVPEETEQSVWRLAAALEGPDPDSWTPERMGDRYQQLKQRIVAFRATVISTFPRFKLGQDEATTVFDEIISGLENSQLAQWMNRAKSGTG